MIEDLKKTYQYELLTAKIESKIKAGAYRAGERLPSIRSLKNTLNLSVNTIERAYHELEMKGLLFSKPKSGYFVAEDVEKKLNLLNNDPPRLPARNVTVESVTQAIHEAMQNKNLLPLGGAVVSAGLLPYKQLARTMKNLSPAAVRSLMVPACPEGLPELRRQIVRRSLGRLDDITPEEIIITNGCKEALSLCVQTLLKPGDFAVVESPAYYGVISMLRQLGVYVLEAPIKDQYGVDIRAVEALLSTHKVGACIFMPNFSNPTGSLMPESKRKKLVALTNRLDIPIIEDDIYSELYFGKKPPGLLKKYDRKGLVLTCSSFSKVLTPGIRVGWVIAPDHFRDRIRRLKTGLSESTSTLDQGLLARFLENGDYESHARILRKTLKAQIEMFSEAIRKHFPPDASVTPPAGGIVLWVKLPKHVDSMTVYRKALDQKIALLPGAVCSLSDAYRNHIRLNCGHPFREKIAEGLAELGGIILELAGEPKSRYAPDTMRSALP